MKRPAPTGGFSSPAPLGCVLAMVVCALLLPSLVWAERFNLQVAAPFVLEDVHLEGFFLRGRLCHRGDGFSPQAGLIFTGDRGYSDDRWQRIFAIDPLGPGQCVDFAREVPWRASDGLQTQVVTFPLPALQPLDRVDPLEVEVGSGSLQLQNCPVAQSEDAFAWLHALDSSDHRLWELRFRLSGGNDCYTIERRLTTFDQRPRSFLVQRAPHTIAQPVDSGLIRPEVAYRAIRLTGQVLTGEFCNLSDQIQPPHLVRFQAIDPTNGPSWVRIVKQPELAVGECRHFSGRLSSPLKPQGWFIAVAEISP